MAVIKIHESLLQSLIQGCIALERDSQKKFYTHFYGYIFSVCHRYVPKEEETIEVLNDAFLKMFKELNRFEPKYNNLEASLKAWLRRIAVNTAVDHLRKQKHEYQLTQTGNFDWQEEATGEWPADRISHKELLDMVSKLSPAYRMVFNLFAIDGYGHEEIAGLLQISVGSSKSNLAKARANLQKMIAEQERLIDYGRKAI